MIEQVNNETLTVMAQKLKELSIKAPEDLIPVGTQGLGGVDVKGYLLRSQNTQNADSCIFISANGSGISYAQIDKETMDPQVGIDQGINRARFDNKQDGFEGIFITDDEMSAASSPGTNTAEQIALALAKKMEFVNLLSNSTMDGLSFQVRSTGDTFTTAKPEMHLVEMVHNRFATDITAIKEKSDPLTQGVKMMDKVISALS